MKITHIHQVPANEVKMDGAKSCRMRLVIGPRDGAPNFALRVFEVASGGHTPLHQHPYEHEIYVLEGSGTVWSEGRQIALKPGDALYVPAGELHQFQNTGSGPFQFICLIPAQFQTC